VTVEEGRVAAGHLVTVTGVDAHRIITDAAAKPETPNCGTGQAHVDAQLPAQVDGRLGLFIPGVAARRWRAVPLLEDQPDVDVFL
jgi:hypothetical protein